MNSHVYSRLAIFLVFADVFCAPVYLGRYYYPPLPNYFIKNNRCTSYIKDLILGRRADTFYNEQGRREALSKFIFGGEKKLQDVFLGSKLAGQEKLSLPGGGNNFGNDPEEQYIYTLRNATLKTYSRTQEVEALIRFLHYFYLSDDGSLLGALGFIFPIEQIKHKLDITLKDASIMGQVSPNPMGGIGQSNIGQFFSDYVSVEDFFENGILRPKGLQLKTDNSKIGVGDIRLLSVLDITPYVLNAEDFKLGINLRLPTGSKRSADIIWDIDLGNGGATQLEMFFSGHLLTCEWYLNPFIYSEVIHSFPFSAKRRVPKRKSQKNQVFLTERFEPFDLAEFCEFDSNALEFADQAIRTRIQYGDSVRLILGNYWKNIFDTQFTVGFFYDVEAVNKTSVRAKDQPQGLFNTTALERNTSRVSHELGWSLSAYFNKQARFFVGSKHVVGGKNVVAYNKIFASLLLYF